MNRLALWAGLAALSLAGTAKAQDLDLSGTPAAPAPPIQITASQGIEFQQADQVVIARGNARGVRGNVTVEADQLIAHYRKKPGAAAAAGAAALDAGGGQLYQLDAVGHVHIFTPTDNAWGDHAVYSLDDAVLVLTGAHLKLTTLHDVITARDAIEYHSGTRMAVARGNALIVADDGRSVAADTLVGYLTQAAPAAAPPVTPGADDLTQAGKLREVDAFGHVVIHTVTDTATGDTGIYQPITGLARLVGDVHITRGANQLRGADAVINLKTGIAQLLAAPGGQVQGTIIPNTATAK